MTGPSSWSMMLRIRADRCDPLQAGRVVDNVLGHEVVEDKSLARLLATEQLLDHLPCAPSTHVESI